MTVIPRIRPEGQSYLFSEGDIRQEMSSRLADLTREIDALPDTDLSTLDQEELVVTLVEGYSLEVPALERAGITQRSSETKVDARSIPHRIILDDSRPIMVPATEVIFAVPFVGDVRLFRFWGSTRTHNPPIATLTDGELEFHYVLTQLDADALNTAFEQELVMVEECLGWLSIDARGFNGLLATEAEGRIVARRKRIRDNADFSTALGYPIKLREGAPRTYTLPKKRRRIHPRRAQTDSAKRPRDLVLSDSVYEEILAVMDQMVTVMEQSPHAFATMGEEDLRTHFLVQLNGQYEGAATGETFNYEGKTDIIIKHEGRNLFIAECLIWDGPQSLSQKLDQLLGYTTWRDTKSAIVVFSRRKNFSKVLEQIGPTVLGHDHAIAEEDVEGETQWRFRLRHRDDPERHLTLTVLAYDVPAHDV